MLITEFRVTLPMTVAEYQVGQLYSVAQASLNETGGGEGVEVQENKPYTDKPLLGGQYTSGQYTKKIYHLGKKVPKLLKVFLSSNALQVLEEAWNAYPYCQTVQTNPNYMKDGFLLKVETLHVDNDRGQLENVHLLDQKQLTMRKVVHVDIANDKVNDTLHDPSTYRSTKTGRGPLKADWLKTYDGPVMTAYKLITVLVKWRGLQTHLENIVMNQTRTVLTKFHREVFCSLDDWVEMDMADIRKLEEETTEKLKEQREKGEVRGNMAD